MLENIQNIQHLHYFISILITPGQYTNNYQFNIQYVVIKYISDTFMLRPRTIVSNHTNWLKIIDYPEPLHKK